MSAILMSGFIPSLRFTSTLIGCAIYTTKIMKSPAVSSF